MSCTEIEKITKIHLYLLYLAIFIIRSVTRLVCLVSGNKKFDSPDFKIIFSKTLVDNRLYLFRIYTRKERLVYSGKSSLGWFENLLHIRLRIRIFIRVKLFGEILNVFQQQPCTKFPIISYVSSLRHNGIPSHLRRFQENVEVLQKPTVFTLSN